MQAIPNRSAQHGTIVLSAKVQAPGPRVWALLADPGEREIMHASGEQMTLLLDEADFRVGGVDILRFGDTAFPRFHVRSTYLDIVAPHRIVTADVSYDRDVRLAIATTTLELIDKGTQTTLKLTAQMTWLDGADAIDALTGRYQALLAHLERYLRQNPVA